MIIAFGAPGPVELTILAGIVFILLAVARLAAAEPVFEVPTTFTTQQWLQICLVVFAAWGYTFVFGTVFGVLLGVTLLIYLLSHP